MVSLPYLCAAVLITFPGLRMCLNLSIMFRKDHFGYCSAVQSLYKPWVQCRFDVPHHPHPILPKLLLQEGNLAQAHPMLPSNSATHLNRLVNLLVETGHTGQIDAGETLISPLRPV